MSTPQRNGSERPDARYRDRAERTVRAAREEWNLSGTTDVRELVRAVMESLAVEAGRDLRQVLFQLRLALDAGAAESQDGRAELQDAIERATAIVRTHLDRDEVQRLLIPIDASRFDLAGAMADHLRLHRLDHSQGVEVRQEPVRVEADRGKLIEVLGHLVSEAVLASRRGQRVQVQVGPAPDGMARVFIGMTPSDATPEDLLRALDAPLSMDVATIDLPYVRAVVERHGGTMRIETTPDGGVGYAFTLPALRTQEVTT